MLRVTGSKRRGGLKGVCRSPKVLMFLVLERLVLLDVGLLRPLFGLQLLHKLMSLLLLQQLTKLAPQRVRCKQLLRKVTGRKGVDRSAGPEVICLVKESLNIHYRVEDERRWR